MSAEPTHHKNSLPKKRRPFIPAALAQQRLIECTIDLLRDLPFDHVTSGRITEAAELTIPTIWRNFESMEGLFANVCRVLLQRSLERWSTERDASIFLDPDFELRTRLIAWLLAEGADPAIFQSGLLTELVDALKQNVGQISDRTATAFTQLSSLILQAYVVFGATMSIPPEQFADNFAFMTHIRGELPRLQTELGWE
jgi:AcrR family transcriptional regulator